MTIREMVMKRKGKWLINHKDNYKVVIDLDKMVYDTYDWYKTDGCLQQELTNEILDDLFKRITICRKI